MTAARLAQSVEHGTLNPRAVVSSPTLGALLFAVDHNVCCNMLSFEFYFDSTFISKYRNGNKLGVEKDILMMI